MKHATLGVLLGLLASSVHCFPVQPAHAHAYDGDRAIVTELKGIRRALERMEAGCK